MPENVKSLLILLSAMKYETLYRDAKILDSETGIPGEFVWYPYGWKMRNLYVERIRELLEEQAFQEWHFTDFL